MPVVPCNRIRPAYSEIRPLCFSISMQFSSVAIPNESYPRYSSFFKPSRIRGAACRLPMYPTIPHTLYHQGAVRDNSGDYIPVSFKGCIVSDNAVPEPGTLTTGYMATENGAKLRVD